MARTLAHVANWAGAEVEHPSFGARWHDCRLIDGLPRCGRPEKKYDYRRDPSGDLKPRKGRAHTTYAEAGSFP
jgi:hypothetical protein